MTNAAHELRRRLRRHRRLCTLVTGITLLVGMAITLQLRPFNGTEPRVTVDTQVHANQLHEKAPTLTTTTLPSKMLVRTLPAVERVKSDLQKGPPDEKTRERMPEPLDLPSLAELGATDDARDMIAYGVEAPHCYLARYTVLYPD